MSATFQEVTREALTLSESERADLAQTLIRSLEPVVDKGIQQAWDVEISRRLDRVRQGTAKGRPAEEVFRDLRAKYEK